MTKDKTVPQEVLNDTALIVLYQEYESLYFIPVFKVRIETAKHKVTSLILKNCSCIKCMAATEFINNLNYTEYE